MTKTTVTDTAGLAQLCGQLAGRKLIDAIAGGDLVELVFEGDAGHNLVTIYTGTFRGGDVDLGSVMTPDAYVRGSREIQLERSSTP